MEMASSHEMRDYAGQIWRRRGLFTVLLAVVLLAGCAGGPQPDTSAGDDTVAPDYRSLVGWREDNHTQAIPALLHTCQWLKRQDAGREIGPGGAGGRAGDWRQACESAKSVPTNDARVARHYFETWFTPVPVSSDPGQEGLFTGYYQPELQGSLTRSDRFRVPLYRMPQKRAGQQLPARAAVAKGALAGKGLELVWVDDPIDAFFLEIQGSGRIHLTDGSTVGIQYAGQNGHAYFPVGKHLIDQGVASADRMSLNTIRKWMLDHPDRTQGLMNLNPSYIFFRLRPDLGARGALAELTPGRSLAVDPRHVPLGVPLWLDLHDAPVPGGTLRRLVVAQDTGGAIKGAVRGDLFWGHGPEAEVGAGNMKAHGHYTMLVPRAAVERRVASLR
ncbi:membrane-bound lytic murein transglycosylase A [uncultured Gammaproteobacteria bacterium]